MNYLLVDGLNTFFRCLHVAQRGSDLEERVAFAVHSTIQSLGAMGRDHKTDHIVFCLEGRSWRKSFYAPYKRNREVARQAKTEQQQQDDKAYFEAYTDLVEFLTLKTNVTVLHHPQLEADDLIAGWIQCHPGDTHTIISTDSDYHQLLAENVSQFSGTTRELHTINGIFDHKGKRVIDKKTKEPKAIPDPQWLLFEKCVRGDSGDNVFSAYPGVRTKGSKNKVGLLEAYADKQGKGFNWNNLMLQRWVDHEGVEHKVLDDYKRNVTLIDLTAQPADIRAILEETIRSTKPKMVPMVGAHFLKFCGKYNLTKLSEQATTYAQILGTSYQSPSKGTAI